MSNAFNGINAAGKTSVLKIILLDLNFDSSVKTLCIKMFHSSKTNACTWLFHSVICKKKNFRRLIWTENLSLL